MQTNIRPFLLIALASASASASAGGVKWQKDFVTAQKVAKRTHKLLMIDFSAPW